MTVSLGVFGKQSYASWTAVYFTGVSTPPLSMKYQNKATMVPSSGNKGRNIELAVTKHCPHRSFAVLLNKGEHFNATNALAALADKLTPRDVVGCFVSLQVGTLTLSPQGVMGRFYRK